MLKIGLIGAGVMGGTHAHVYAGLGEEAKLVSVCDAVNEKAEKLAKLTNANIFGLNEFNKFINSGIDIVDVCLPTFLHPEYAIKAAKAGKNVICEKPMALTVKEADSMIAAAKKSKVKFMIAHCIRFWPEYIILKDFVAEGQKLGKLKSLSLTRLGGMPTWSWNNWLANGKQSGGAVLDLHIHDTDFVLYLLGLPKSVYSVGSFNKAGLSHVYTTYNYKNVAVVAEGGWDMQEKFGFNMNFLANFERGSLSYGRGHTPNFLCYENGKEPWTPELPKVEMKSTSADTGGNISSLGGYHREIIYFLDCVKKNKSPKIVTPWDARESVRVVLAEFESVKSGKVVKI